MYFMVCTHLDLTYAISILSRYMASPEKVHWLAKKWLLRYIGFTIGLGLHYVKHSNKVEVEGYVDSNHTGDRDTRKSTTAYFYKVCGNYVRW